MFNAHNYCKKPGHTIDKCYKLQRIKSQPHRGRRIAAALVHQSENVLPFFESSATVPSTSGQHTLSSEKYAKVLALLSKQDVEITQPVESQHASYLASKSFLSAYFL